MTGRESAVAKPVVLGLHFGLGEIAAALCDDAGHRLAEASVHPVPAEGARWNLELGVAAGQHLLRRESGRLELVAIGAASFEVLGEHPSEFAEDLAGWGELALASELGRSFGCLRVAVLGELEAAATAEASNGVLRGCDRALYVRVNEQDVAIALILGGRVITGASGPPGASGAAVGASRQAAALEPAGDTRSDLRSASARLAALVGSVEASSAVCSSGEALDEAIDELARVLAFSLFDWAHSLDPARIALSGELARWWPRLKTVLSKALHCAGLRPPELCLAAFPVNGALIGALVAGLAAAPPVGLSAARPIPARRDAADQCR